MTTDEALAAEVRAALSAAGAITEIKMFGGLGFMLNGNMVAAVSKRGLLLRVGKDRYAKALARPGARPVEMRGRAMEGYLYVDPPALTTSTLETWLRGVGVRRVVSTEDEGCNRRCKAHAERRLPMTRFILMALAYAVPTFLLGFVWHLVLFKPHYDALAIYRSDIIIPFGMLAILLQAGIYAWVYEKAIAPRGGTLMPQAMAYGALGAVLSWTFTTLAVAPSRTIS